MAVKYTSKNPISRSHEKLDTLRGKGTLMGLTKATQLLLHIEKTLHEDDWQHAADGLIRADDTELTLTFGNVPDLHLNGHEDRDFLRDYAWARTRAMQANMKRQAKRKFPSESLAAQIHEDMLQVDRARRYYQHGAPAIPEFLPTDPTPPSSPPPFRPAS